MSRIYHVLFYTFLFYKFPATVASTTSSSIFGASSTTTSGSVFGAKTVPSTTTASVFGGGSGRI